MSDILRTPQDRFANLPGYDFAPHYVSCNGLRMHYVDAGTGRDGRVFLCLHGQPTWSYLYRHMIPVFTATGHRAVAPDLIGFGRSDKPTEDARYTFDFHRASLIAFLQHLDAQRITLVVQDWGGLLGLTLPMHDARIDQLIVMNTTLAIGAMPGPGFLAWRDYAAANPNFQISRLMQRSCPDLTSAEAAAYDAPFPTGAYRAGVRRFPAIVPTTPDEGGAQIAREAARFLAQDWTGKSFVACGTQDPIFNLTAMQALSQRIAGAPAAVAYPEAGHFLQEHGEVVARDALAALDLG